MPDPPPTAHGSCAEARRSQEWLPYKGSFVWVAGWGKGWVGKMAEKKGSAGALKSVETITHDEASRVHIPTAEYQSLLPKEYETPIRVAYERRNRDLDPQLVWRGKDLQDWSDLVVNAPPLYIQEKVHPKALIDDLVRRTKANRPVEEEAQYDLFADFNGLPNKEAKTEFYEHEANWTNRMILGDSLQVMASLAEREGLRGKVQCIYFDPPYGIKFNSNFQWSTTNRDVKDGDKSHITREPEQVKAFRDTWRDGIHSYLTYLRDRLMVARDLLCESGSIVVQIGQDNSHLIRSLLDEAFGAENFVSQIVFSKTAGTTAEFLSGTYDVLAFYARRRECLKFRQPLVKKHVGGAGGSAYKKLRMDDLSERALTEQESNGMAPLPLGSRVFRIDNLTSQSVGRDKGEGAASWFPVSFEGKVLRPSEKVRWKTNEQGMRRLSASARLAATGTGLYYVRYFEDFAAFPEDNIWSDTGIAGFASDKRYVVETSEKVIQRFLLMTTDPGDLILDPTCGSGTTAYVAEQWGRRWITIDTSRVALALARARIMGARYGYYLLADSAEGKAKEASVTRTVPSSQTTHGDIRQGFVYERVPHVQLSNIAKNAEIDVIWEKFQLVLEPLRAQLNPALNKQWEEWEIPREADPKWPEAARSAHAEWWKQRIARQREIDASIAAKADYEYLYDKPYEDKSKVRVAGPFTVESLSPHRMVGVGEDGELLDPQKKHGTRDFAAIILENLKAAGVQHAHKADKIEFSSVTAWPGGGYVCAVGVVDSERRVGDPPAGYQPAPQRAAIFIGPEFGTVTRPDLVAAAREAGDAGFDMLIACAFNFDAHSTDLQKLGRLPILKARMNADLHMAEDLKNTGKGNLFVVFGEPDIELRRLADGRYEVEVKGVDVFRPSTGEVHSDGPDTIACWFLDSDYNEESFFVRHAYFLGSGDPYKSLKTTLKAEVDEEAWSTLRSAVSRPFERPESGRIAVKVINHLGDEVMKVFRV